MSDGMIPPISDPESLLNNNRGYDNDLAEGPPEVVFNLELVDETILNYMIDVINPKVTKVDRSIPVPIMYANPERWKSVQEDGFVRDPKNDKLQAPLILVRRTKIARNDMTNPSNKYVYKTFTNQWNKRNVYDRFAVQNRITPSMQMRNVLIPDYVTISYDILMWTDYESQMNQLIEQINAENEEWWGNRNAYKFRTRIEDYDKKSELPPTGDRVVRTQFTLNVFAYLLPEQIIRNFKPSSTNDDIYTRKKTIVFTEVEGI